jgi:hypothetical protein
MAVVNFYKTTDMNNVGAWEGTITNASSTNITVENFAGNIASYDGLFTYTADGLDLSGGTLTGYSEYTSNTLHYTVSSLSLDAVVVKNYILAGDAFGLVEYVASGADTFIGSSGADLLASLAGDDLLQGNAGSDVLYGGTGDDDLSGGSGDDYLAGETGVDWALFQGTRAAYTLQTASGSYTVSDSVASRDGTDTLVGVERVQFSDQSVNLTVGSLAGTISAAQLGSLIELYIAYIARVPDADGMAFWINQLKAGQTLNQIGESFYNSAVQFSSLTGYSATMTDADFVTLVYRNVLGRSEPDAGGLAFWSNELATGHSSRGTLVASILGSAHSFKGDVTYGYVADLLDNKVEVGKLFAIEQGLVYNTSADSITHGMQIASAITATSIDQAVALIGVNDGFSLV